MRCNNCVHIYRAFALFILDNSSRLSNLECFPFLLKFAYPKLEVSYTEQKKVHLWIICLPQRNSPYVPLYETLEWEKFEILIKFCSVHLRNIAASFIGWITWHGTQMSLLYVVPLWIVRRLVCLFLDIAVVVLDIEFLQ